MYRQFSRIFETFRISEPEKLEDASKDQLQKEPIRDLELKKVPKLEDEYEEEEEEEEVKDPLDQEWAIFPSLGAKLSFCLRVEGWTKLLNKIN
jgi:hypothetical protein